MKTYVVLFHEKENAYPANPPLLFRCEADDLEHAEEQCENAYPDCLIAWVYEGSDLQKARKDYLQQ